MAALQFVKLTPVGAAGIDVGVRVDFHHVRLLGERKGLTVHCYHNQGAYA